MRVQSLQYTSSSNPNTTSTRNTPQQSPIPPALHRGWLRKHNREVKVGSLRSILANNWKERFVILEKGILTYFVNEFPIGVASPAQPKGKFSLSQCVCKRIDRRLIVTPLTTSNISKDVIKPLTMEAGSEKEASKWIDALNAHCIYATTLELFPENFITKTNTNTITNTIGLNNPDNSDETPAKRDNEIQVLPEPVFVIKTKRMNSDDIKLFINIVQHSSIPASSMNDPEWPYLYLSTGRWEGVNQDTHERVFDCGVHPSVIVSIENEKLSLQNNKGESNNDDNDVLLTKLCVKALFLVGCQGKDNLGEEFSLPRLANKYRGANGVQLLSLPTNFDDYNRKQKALSMPMPIISGLGHEISRRNSSNNTNYVRSLNLSTPISSLIPSLASVASPAQLKLQVLLQSSPIPLHIPYFVCRTAGALARVKPDRKSPGRVLPQGERVEVTGRRRGLDGAMWMKSDHGWIPESNASLSLSSNSSPKRSPGIASVTSSSSPLVPRCYGRPERVEINSIQFVEQTKKSSMFSWLFGSTQLTEVSLAFIIDLHYTANSLVSIRRSFGQFQKLRLDMMQALKVYNKQLAKSIGALTFASASDVGTDNEGLCSEQILYDPSLVCEMQDTISAWLNSLLRIVPPSHGPLLLKFLDPTPSDCIHMEHQLLANGGFRGTHIDDEDLFKI